MDEGGEGADSDDDGGEDTESDSGDDGRGRLLRQRLEDIVVNGGNGLVDEGIVVGRVSFSCPWGRHRSWTTTYCHHLAAGFLTNLRLEHFCSCSITCICCG